MKFHLQKGHRYEAIISLGFLEKLASNATILGKLVDAGFKDVDVCGGGGTRHAEGTWDGEDQWVELPKEIVTVKALES